MNLSQWMSYLPEEFGQKPIYEILLPGTHDSAAFNYLPEARFEGSKSNWASKFYKLPPVKSTIERWTLTQDLNFYEQLNSGIRKFDLRLSYDQSQNQFYFSHTFATVRVEEGLEQIRAFLRATSQEILFLECQPDFNNRQTISLVEADRFLEIVRFYLGGWLVPNLHHNRISSNLTLQNLTDLNQRVFFVYKNKHTPQDDIWRMKILNLRSWTSDLSEKWEIIENFLEQHQDQPNDGTKHQELALTLTPQTSDVVNGIFNPCSSINSVRQLTEQIHAQMYSKLESWDLSKINSLIVDFPDETFVEWVIQYNLNFR